MRAWRGPGQAHSAILLPVAEAEAVVGRWRNLFDPMAGAGIPAHITLIVPWLVPEAITEADIDRLGVVLAKTMPFEFDLDALGWFGPGVLWLSPRPAEPFLAMIGAIANEFGTPPWGGEFPNIVPHLTVAHTIEGQQLGGVASRLAGDLPIPCRAREATVMVGDGSRWWEQANLHFGER